MKRIAIITSTRAEYGLLRPLINEIARENTISADLLVSGTHLLKKYGDTIDQIKRDGFPIAYEIPIFDENFISDEVHVAEAISKATLLCGEIFAKENYDAMVVLGDRYELLGFCAAAVVCRLPIIHIHGGEITEGAIDDKIRHAITKLASLHFPSVSEYANRIIQMGEDPQMVYAVGALGIDNIMQLNLMDKEALKKELNIHTLLPIAAVTYHPVTSEKPEEGQKEVRCVLDALLEAGLYSVITMPNSDVGGDIIYEEMQHYEEMYPDRMVIKKSLGQLRYLSLLKNADIMVGNSSSGILESASFRLPTVDIGARQKGRMTPENVIHCECQKDEIKKAIQRGMSIEFKDKLINYESPYGDGHAAERMVEIIKRTDFKKPSMVSKKFIDIR